MLDTNDVRACLFSSWWLPSSSSNDTALPEVWMALPAEPCSSSKALPDSGASVLTFTFVEGIVAAPPISLLSGPTGFAAKDGRAPFSVCNAIYFPIMQ